MSQHQRLLREACHLPNQGAVAIDSGKKVSTRGGLRQESSRLSCCKEVDTQQDRRQQLTTSGLAADSFARPILKVDVVKSYAITRPASCSRQPQLTYAALQNSRGS